MARFLIEVTHDAEEIACARAIRMFITSGSHFLNHTDWGCMDGDHRGWVIVDVPGRNEAIAVIPQALRSSARVIALNRFSLPMIDAILNRGSSSVDTGD
jgi:hypothetical protein